MHPQINAIETPWFLPDELVDFVREVNLPPPDYSAPHRYQIFGVIRDDAPAVYINDLGLATADEGFLLILGGGDGDGQHTFTEAIDLCEERRDNKWLRNFLAEEQGKSTLNKDLEHMFDERSKAVASKSSFGPMGAFQRSAFRKSAMKAKEHAKRSS